MQWHAIFSETKSIMHLIQNHFMTVQPVIIDIKSVEFNKFDQKSLIMRHHKIYNFDCENALPLCKFS